MLMKFEMELKKLFGYNFEIKVIIKHNEKLYGFAMPTHFNAWASLDSWPILIGDKDGNNITFTYDEEDLLPKDIARGQKVFENVSMYA